LYCIVLYMVTSNK